MIDVKFLRSVTIRHIDFKSSEHINALSIGRISKEIGLLATPGDVLVMKYLKTDGSRRRNVGAGRSEYPREIVHSTSASRCDDITPKTVNCTSKTLKGENGSGGFNPVVGLPSSARAMELPRQRIATSQKLATSRVNDTTPRKTLVLNCNSTNCNYVRTIILDPTRRGPAAQMATLRTSAPRPPPQRIRTYCNCPPLICPLLTKHRSPSSPP